METNRSAKRTSSALGKSVRFDSCDLRVAGDALHGNALGSVRFSRNTSATRETQRGGGLFD
jgi:hypothetical protein